MSNLENEELTDIISYQNQFNDNFISIIKISQL